eukprot:2683918-Pyramimonas_sp.AAC.1
MQRAHQAAPSSLGLAEIHALLAGAPHEHMCGLLSPSLLRLAEPGRPLHRTRITWCASVKEVQLCSSVHSSPSEGCHLLPWLVSTSHLERLWLSICARGAA